MRSILAAAALIAAALLVLGVVRSALDTTGRDTEDDSETAEASEPQVSTPEEPDEPATAVTDPAAGSDPAPSNKPSLGATLDIRVSWNTIDGYGWPAGEPLIVIVDDDDDTTNGALLDVAGKVSPDAAGSWSMPLDTHGIQLAAGQLVTVETASAKVSHQVTAPSVSSIDTKGEIVSGTAEPRVEIVVAIHGDLSHAKFTEGGPIRTVIADSDGRWSADFSKEGSGEQEDTWDIIAGQEGCVSHILPGGSRSRVIWVAP